MESIKVKISIEQEIEQFLNYFDDQRMAAFIRDFEELFSLFNGPAPDNEDEANVTLIRAAYLISRIAEFHGGALLMVNTRFPKMWRRMYNKFIEEKTDGQEDKKDRERDKESGVRPKESGEK